MVDPMAWVENAIQFNSIRSCGVICMASQLLKYTFRFYNHWKDAKAEKKSFILELGALKDYLTTCPFCSLGPKFCKRLQR